MSRNIIDLDEKYAISADDMNIVLHERKVNTDEKSKNFGNVYYSNLGYYSNVEGLLKGMINKKINVDLQNTKDLSNLNSNIEGWISKLHDNVVSIVKELRK
jgi:hypothetical protein